MDAGRNSRLIPSISNIDQLKDIARMTTSPARVVRDGWAIAAAMVPTRQIIGKPDLKAAIDAYCNGAIEKVEMVERNLKLFHYPHDVIRENISCFQENIAHRIARGDYQQFSSNVFLASNVQIGQYVVTDTESGRIVVAPIQRSDLSAS